MGLRGPGAKPVKKRQEGEAPAPKRPDWSRSRRPVAEQVIAFIETLPLTRAKKVKGRLPRLKLRPWQKAFIRAVLATDPAGKRMVRTAVLTMARKNGKTQFAAALALAALCGPLAEERGEVYSAAVDRNQAALLYRELKAFIEADEELSARIIIRDFNKSLEDTETGSIYQALSADAKSKHGFNASFVVYDELAQAPNRELFDVLTTSSGTREAPLTLVISTMSANPHAVMSELVDYGRQVNESIVQDPTFHATILTTPMDADIWDEASWYASNPALGDFRSLQEMRAYAAQARRIPARESTFRLLYLNQPVEADERWIAGDVWDGCRGDVDLDALRGERCYAGLDLGSTKDLTSLALWFPDKGALLSWSWIPADTVRARVETDRVPYDHWIREGLIETTPGAAVNRRHIATRLVELSAAFDLRAVAFDRWRIEDLQVILAEEGIVLPLTPFGQGYKDLGPAVDLFETLVLRGELTHTGNPVLTWALSNVALEQDPAGARKLSKDRSRERIDPVAAAVMAVAVAAKDKPAPVPSVDVVFV